MCEFVFVRFVCVRACIFHNIFAIPSGLTFQHKKFINISFDIRTQFPTHLDSIKAKRSIAKTTNTRKTNGIRRYLRRIDGITATINTDSVNTNLTRHKRQITNKNTRKSVKHTDRQIPNT